MKILVNKNLCIGCGLCTQIAPKSFKMGEDDKSEGINPPGDSEEKINEAKDNCPVSAIEVV